ncbi:MAG: sugar phosphate isomerase/epimerase [Clostridia bacterium]|nr:sugar phosphate isomerase/epimerase [Clostridia bacterium]
MKFGTMTFISAPSDCDEKFSRLRENGFDACQLVYKPEVYTDEAAKEIKSRAEYYGIDISAQFAGFRDAEIAWYDTRYLARTLGIAVPAYRLERMKYLKSAIEFASKAGIPDVVIHAGYIPNDLLSEGYADMLTAVDSVAKHCEAQGVNLLLETGTECPIILKALIEDVGRSNVYINFDPANILMYGFGNPVDALTVFGKYVRNMHGKDGCLPTNPHRFGEEKAVGQGMVDFPAIFRKFREIGYDRYCIIEREISGEQQLRDILAAKEYLTSLV